MFIKNKHSCPNGHSCLFLINHSISVFIYYVKQSRSINLIRNKLVSPQTCKLRSCVFNLYPFTNYLFFIDCWGITGSSKSLLRLYFRFSTFSKSHFLANSLITWKVRLISACCVCSSTDVKRFIQKLANLVLEGLFSFTKKKGCSLREGDRTDSTTLMGNFTLWRKENFALYTTLQEHQRIRKNAIYPKILICIHVNGRMLT